MESDLQPNYHFPHDQPQQQHQKPMNSGLARYQSAPSTYFSSFLDRELSEDFLNRPTSPETVRILSRFLSNSEGSTDNLSNQNLGAMKQESPASEAEMQEQANNQPQMMASIKNNNDIAARFNQQQQTNYSSAPQSFYHSQSKPPLMPDHGSSSGMDYRAGSSMGLQRLPPMRTGGGSNSNLVRHSSSPAGLFSNINIEFENGYAVVKGMGDFGASNREASYPAASRPASSSGRMSPIAEMGDRNMSEDNQDNAGYLQDFSIGSWDDTAVIPSVSKGLISDDRTLSSGLIASETQNVEAGKPPRMLAHHLSLPSSSIEKYLQIQDSVPCKIRAKRGCATHPRSIAERVRRTRISERMRKLQDLVPNMDKQTNTADMLDLAVDYIKDLQRQLQGLQDDCSKCTCGNKDPS